MSNLALGSLEEVLRSRGSNFILESSRFDEVLIESRHRKLASDTTGELFVRPVYTGFGLACHVSRDRHQMRAPDLRCVCVPLPTEGVKLVSSPDASRVRTPDAPVRPM